MHFLKLINEPPEEQNSFKNLCERNNVNYNYFMNLVETY